jgi:hypothetical protein
MNAMRVSNKCYSRDLRSIELARRMLRLEARTETICDWTGLTGDRVRNLSRVLAREGVSCCASRQRGPSPRKFSALMESPCLRKEAPAIAGLCRVFDVIPAEPRPDARTTLPGVVRGERLCDALELFRQIIPGARITLEKLVLLVFTVAAGDTWTLEFCAGCQATILIDRLELSRRLCSCCAPRTGAKRLAARDSMLTPEPETTERFVQHSLF